MTATLTRPELMFGYESLTTVELEPVLDPNSAGQESLVNDSSKVEAEILVTATENDPSDGADLMSDFESRLVGRSAIIIAESSDSLKVLENEAGVRYSLLPGWRFYGPELDCAEAPLSGELVPLQSTNPNAWLPIRTLSTKEEFELVGRNDTYSPGSVAVNAALASA